MRSAAVSTASMLWPTTRSPATPAAEPASLRTRHRSSPAKCARSSSGDISANSDASRAEAASISAINCLSSRRCAATRRLRNASRGISASRSSPRNNVLIRLGIAIDRGRCGRLTVLFKAVLIAMSRPETATEPCLTLAFTRQNVSNNGLLKLSVFQPRGGEKTKWHLLL